MNLGLGSFYGDYQSQRSVDGVALAELTPTVPEHEVAVHTHDDAHLVLVLKGAYLSSARGMPAICTAPALILNPPGTRHRDCFRGLNGRFFTLSLPATHWIAAVDRRRLPDTALRLSGRAQLGATRLRNELRHWDSASPLTIETGIEDLLDEAESVQRSECRDGPAWLSRTRDRLHDDCTATPSLAELARLADVHPVSLSRAFRRQYGCSPGDYLRRCRMDLAIALLHKPGLPLSTIADRCGFSDPSHFSHAFRRAHGLSPQHYRQMC